MPNSNGRIYVDNSTNPPKGVSFADVQTVLGTTADTEKALCQHSSINKWAKYKPVKYAKIGLMTTEDREAANYGITNIPTWNNINKMATFWLLEDHSSSTNYPKCGLQIEYWKYNKPTGGSSSPFRLADFSEYPVSEDELGYYHDAEAPISQMSDINLSITPNGQLVMVWPNGAQDDRTLLYSDLYYNDGSQISLSGFYFTAILARVNSTTTKYVMTDVNQTAQEAIEYGAHCRPWFQDLTAVNSFMGGSNVSSAQFYLTCFLCNEEIYDTFTNGSSTYRKFKTSLGSLSANKFVALISRQTVTITKVSVEFPITQLSATRIVPPVNRQINYSFRITNTDNENRRFYYITVEVRDSNQNVLATRTYNSAKDYVNGGSTKTISDSVDVGSYYNGASVVVVTSNINTARDNAMITATNTEAVNIQDGTPSLE